MTQLALRTLINALQEPSFPTELYQHTVGFDRLFDDLRRNIAHVADSTSNYPPHNIRKISDNVYALDLAVAGFRKSDITISVEKQVLTITGSNTASRPETEYLYRGLAMRSFEKRIPLVETAEVREASLEDGILTIVVENVLPEKQRKRSIPITSAVALPSET